MANNKEKSWIQISNHKTCRKNGKHKAIKLLETDWYCLETNFRTKG